MQPPYMCARFEVKGGEGGRQGRCRSGLALHNAPMSPPMPALLSPVAPSRSWPGPCSTSSLHCPLLLPCRTFQILARPPRLTFHFISALLALMMFMPWA